MCVKHETLGPIALSDGFTPMKVVRNDAATWRNVSITGCSCSNTAQTKSKGRVVVIDNGGAAR